MFFNESFIPAIEERFSFKWKPSTIRESSFLLAETVADMSGNYFLKADLVLVETHFLASGNHFLPLPQIFFKKFFIPASGKTFSSPEEKALFFT